MRKNRDQNHSKNPRLKKFQHLGQLKNDVRLLSKKSNKQKLNFDEKFQSCKAYYCHIYIIPSL